MIDNNTLVYYEPFYRKWVWSVYNNQEDLLMLGRSYSRDDAIRQARGWLRNHQNEVFT